MGMFHYLRAWLSAGSIANILSLSSVTSKCRVIMDSNSDLYAKVKIELGAWMRFALNDIGLRMHEIRSDEEFISSNNITHQVNNYSFV